MPPSAGLPRANARADANALGVVALSLLIGRVLKEDEYPGQLQALLEATSERHDGQVIPLSPSFSTWLGRALQFDVKNAFQSPHEAQVALRSRARQRSRLRHQADRARRVGQQSWRPARCRTEAARAGASRGHPRARARTRTRTRARAAAGAGTRLGAEAHHRNLSGCRPSLCAPRRLCPSRRPCSPSLQQKSPCARTSPPSLRRGNPREFGAHLSNPTNPPTLAKTRASYGETPPYAASGREARARGTGPSRRAQPAGARVAGGRRVPDARGALALEPRAGRGASRSGRARRAVAARSPRACRSTANERGVTPITMSLPSGAHVLEVQIGKSEPRVIPLTIQIRRADRSIHRAAERPDHRRPRHPERSAGRQDHDRWPEPRHVAGDDSRPAAGRPRASCSRSSGRKVTQSVRIEAGITAQLVVPIPRR